jgi:hypothetical protein
MNSKLQKSNEPASIIEEVDQVPDCDTQLREFLIDLLRIPDDLLLHRPLLAHRVSLLRRESMWLSGRRRRFRSRAANSCE